MKRTMRGLALAAALVLSATGGGCMGVGLEDVLNGGLGELSGNELRGEVRNVNTRSRYIEIHTVSGRYETVRYDSRTQVVYRDRRYSPTVLERGDDVTVRVHRDGRGERYADAVYVRGRGDDGWYGDRDRRDRDRRDDDDIRRDRDRDRRDDDDIRRDRDRDRDRRDDRAHYEVRSLEGRVARVQRHRGRFQMRSESHGVVWVQLGRSADASDRRRLERLRDGDYVRLRGRFVGSNRFEVNDFR